MRRIHLASHLTTDELEARYRQAREPHERSWWQIRWLLARGQIAQVVDDSTGSSAYWIDQIAKRSDEQGSGAMINRQHTWVRQTPGLLSGAQVADLRQALTRPLQHPLASAGAAGWWANG